MCNVQHLLAWTYMSNMYFALIGAMNYDLRLFGSHSLSALSRELSNKTQLISKSRSHRRRCPWKNLQIASDVSIPRLDLSPRLSLLMAILYHMTRTDPALRTTNLTRDLRYFIREWTWVAWKEGAALIFSSLHLPFGMSVWGECGHFRIRTFLSLKKMWYTKKGLGKAEGKLAWYDHCEMA